MRAVTDDEERAIRRHQYVQASSRRIWRIAFVACAAILALGVGGAAIIRQQALQAQAAQATAREQARDQALARQQTRDIACVKKWADDYTRRADQINALSQPRSDALDRLVVSITLHNRALFDQRLREYLAASAKARQNAVDNPLPPSPVFACGLDPSTGPRQYTPPPTTPNRIGHPTQPASTTHPSRSPAGATRTATPARHDATTRTAAPVVPTRSTVAPRPGGASTQPPAPRPTVTVVVSPPPLLRLGQLCIHVPLLLATC